MATVAPSRLAAVKAFADIRRRDARARDFLRNSAELAGLDARDRALAQRLVMGAVAARGELDRVINSRLKAKASLEPMVRDALRVSAFEILYLETPKQVAVSQGVELVRSFSKRAAGLANAVLRRVSSEDARVLAAARKAVAAGDFTASDLARIGAVPEWLAERAVASMGADAAARYAAVVLSPNTAAVGVNRAKVTVDEALRLLDSAGCEPVAGPLDGSVLLGNPAALVNTSLVEDVVVLPCDLAAQEAVLLAAPSPGSHVLEVGQGRATKTVLLEAAAHAAGGACQIDAVEISESKSRLAAERCERGGVAAHVSCLCGDGCVLDGIDGPYDLVFVDAPCSGTGTLQRHPEIAWSLDEASLPDLCAMQLRMLQVASAHVKRAGRLVYSTCSFLEEENEQVIEAFLSSPQGLGFSPITLHRTEIAGADKHFVATLRAL